MDNEDGTVTDRATGLTWMQVDSGHRKAGTEKDGRMGWAEALAWAEGLRYAGKSDWRLPNAKELQSIVDYTRAPDATNPARQGPAIDPIFDVVDEEAWCWTGTTLLEGPPTLQIGRAHV